MLSRRPKTTWPLLVPSWYTEPKKKTPSELASCETFWNYPLHNTYKHLTMIYDEFRIFICVLNTNNKKNLCLKVSSACQISWSSTSLSSLSYYYYFCAFFRFYISHLQIPKQNQIYIRKSLELRETLVDRILMKELFV